MSRNAEDGATFDLVTIDAVDSVVLARFWATALQLGVEQEEDEGRWIVLGSSDRPRVLGIQRISGLQPASSAWKGREKGRLHLDLACAPAIFDDEVERLVAVGARRLRPDRTEAYGSIATLADPEGNVFDLCAYGPMHAQ